MLTTDGRKVANEGEQSVQCLAAVAGLAAAGTTVVLLTCGVMSQKVSLNRVRVGQRR